MVFGHSPTRPHAPSSACKDEEELTRGKLWFDDFDLPSDTTEVRGEGGDVLLPGEAVAEQTARSWMDEWRCTVHLRVC